MAKKEKSRAERSKGMKTVKVIIEVERLGQFKKGEEIDMHETTAAACVKSGAVKLKTSKK